MIAEVAVQDVARKEYGKDYVRDSTTKEDSRGSDFFVKVRVFYYGKEKTEDLWFGLDVKTGWQQSSKIQNNNKVVIDSDHIDSDTFSVWPGYVGSVEESIANKSWAKVIILNLVGGLGNQLFQTNLYGMPARLASCIRLPNDGTSSR